MSIGHDHDAFFFCLVWSIHLMAPKTRFPNHLSLQIHSHIKKGRHQTNDTSYEMIAYQTCYNPMAIIFFIISASLLKDIGPIHLKDEMHLSWGRKSGLKICPEAETFRPKMTIRPLDVESLKDVFTCLGAGCCFSRKSKSPTSFWVNCAMDGITSPLDKVSIITLRTPLNFHPFCKVTRAIIHCFLVNND